jgi:hypothetical protein
MWQGIVIGIVVLYNHHASCGGTGNGTSVYADFDSCLSKCCEYDPFGTFGDLNGDTLACRYTYAAHAFEGNATINCPLAGEAAPICTSVNGASSTAATMISWITI